MRKFTKLVLTLAMLFGVVGGVNSVYAKKFFADLSTGSGVGSATWTAGTNTFAWTASSYAYMVVPGGSFVGDLSEFTTIGLTVSGLVNEFRVDIIANGKTFTGKSISANGNIVLDILSDFNKQWEATKISVEDLKSVTAIRLNTNSASGSAVVTNFYLEGPDINYIEDKTIQVTPTGTVDLNGITGTGAAWEITYPLTIGDGTLFGSYTIDGDAQSADIDSYDYLLFNVTEASADAKTYLRVFVSTANSNDNSTRVCLYPHPIADYASVSDWTEETTITEPGIYVVKISDYPLLRGIKNKAYWQGAAGSIKISLAYVGSGSPVAPVDEVVRVGEEAVTNASVTCIDVTKLAATGITYDAVNPNCLFIAKAGQLTNTKNVIVGGVCANLELVDGKPFKAPADFTATAAKFTKTVSDAGFATMVMPFDAALATGVKAYNLTGVSGTTITHTDADAIAANKPVLIEAAADDYEFTATDAAIAATADGVVTNGLLNGTYATATAAVDANNYVLQKNGSDVGFFLVTGTPATVKPFRAYLNTTSPASELYLDINNLTGIETVKAEKANNEIFNLAGQRVAKAAKGLYIVNGKKVVVK